MYRLLTATSVVALVTLSGIASSAAQDQPTPTQPQCIIKLGLNVHAQAPMFSPDLKGYPETVTSDMMSTISVTEVVAGLPADKAGVQPGDILAEVDGERVGNVNEPGLTLAQVLLRITSGAAGSTVVITVKRNGERKIIPVERTCVPR